MNIGTQECWWGHPKIRFHIKSIWQWNSNFFTWCFHELCFLPLGYLTLPKWLNSPYTFLTYWNNLPIIGLKYHSSHCTVAWKGKFYYYLHHTLQQVSLPLEKHFSSIVLYCRILLMFEGQRLVPSKWLPQVWWPTWRPSTSQSVWHSCSGRWPGGWVYRQGSSDGNLQADQIGECVASEDRWEAGKQTRKRQDASKARLEHWKWEL